MSRIGKKHISIPSGVTINLENKKLQIKGPKGEMTIELHPRITIDIIDQTLHIKRNSQEKLDRSLHGLTRSLIMNTITGVTKGFAKRLEIQGVGYRVAVQGKKLTFNLGLSHPVEYELPAGLEAEIDKEKKNILTIKGLDKQLVGQISAIIRGFKKPEPYKGKGIRYIDEVIVRKAGKTATKEKAA